MALDEPLAIDAWVAEAGRADMPLPLLCNLMMELPAMIPLQPLPEIRATTPGNKVMQKKLEKLSFKVTLGELSDAADPDTHTLLMQLAEKVGNKHPELSLETPIDLNVLAAETGPEMPAIQLGFLIRVVISMRIDLLDTIKRNHLDLDIQVAKYVGEIRDAAM